MKKIYNAIFIACLFLINTVQLQPANAQVTLNLKLFIQGYYTGFGQMQPALLNEQVPGATSTETDTILIQLHTASAPYTVIQGIKTLLMTNGTATAFFSAALVGNSYYIGVKSRNALETWSKSPIAMTTVTNYNFSDTSFKAYAWCEIQLSPGIWAFNSGDINQDQNIDLIDFAVLDYDIIHGVYGYYATDLNGDGNVDLFDFIILYDQINSGTFGSCIP